MLTTLLATGCSDVESTNAEANGDDPLRIVTLAPALTRMVDDLGLGDSVVAVAEHDRTLDRALPVIGHYLDVDYERLIEVAPTHVLMMTGRQGAPPRLAEVSDRLGAELVTFAYPDSIEDVLEIVSSESEVSLGDVLSVEDRAADLRERIEGELEAASSIAGEPQRVLLAFETTPALQASGPGTVNHALLERLGHINAVGDAAVMAPEFGREQLLAINPDVILLLAPDEPPLAEDDPRLALFDGLPINAVQDGRIILVNDPDALLPSSSLGRVATTIAAALNESDTSDTPLAIGSAIDE